MLMILCRCQASYMRWRLRVICLIIVFHVCLMMTREKDVTFLLRDMMLPYYLLQRWRCLRHAADVLLLRLLLFCFRHVADGAMPCRR